MRILFDHQIFQLQNFGGISRYFSELISNLQGAQKTEIGIKFSDNRYLIGKDKIQIKPFVDQRHDFLKGIEFYGKGRIYNLFKKVNPSKYFDFYQANREYSIGLLKKQEFDIFHPTYYDDYFLEFIEGKPFVVTIHDMTYEKYPEFFPVADQTPMMKKNLALKASHIISVSENTKKDIITFWGIEEEKISVIHHGVSISESINSSGISVPEDYILFVGARNVYKNFLFFIHSIAGILNDKNLNLVCTGEPFSIDEIKLFRFLGIENKVFHRSVNDSELSYLYKNALVFVFPSLYEGFGIPILEAFANNCPVLLSDSGCFCEIAGEAALYFDPKNSKDIQDKIVSIIESKALREELILKGIVRLKNFSWDKAAFETAIVYNRVLNNRSN